MAIQDSIWGDKANAIVGLRPSFSAKVRSHGKPGAGWRTRGTRPFPIGFCYDTVPKGRLRVAQDAVLGMIDSTDQSRRGRLKMSQDD
jgi:hypothetical protein